jgi:hypothetical protein
MSSDVPVLFLVFKRPQIAQKAFIQIRKNKPSKLYMACDGPRSNVDGESLLVEQTKKVLLDMIDWPCEVRTLFQKENLGCARAVFTAINWLFDNEEYGVIIEDDCVVQDSFFPFVSELLERYKNDSRIGMIDGANYIKYPIKDSYCFSKYKSTNGWATWRRAWLNMDMDMKWRGTVYDASIVGNMGYRGADLRYWKFRINEVDKKHVSAWDWQWYFTLAAQNQLSIFPKVSLVSNIGFGEGATHTGGKASQEYIATDDIKFPLVHPLYVLPDIQFDKAFFRQNNTLFYTLMRYVPFSLKRMVKKIIQ